MKTHARSPASRARRGHGLLEVLVVATVLALLLCMAGLTVSTSRGAYGQGMTSADVEVQARRALDWMSDELLSASAASIAVDELAPPPPASAVTWLDYRSVLGFAGSAQTGDQRRLQLALQAGELDDGLDNNGNGLIDECRIELLPDAQSSAKTIGLFTGVRRLAAGELKNGLDDNGNGLVDEPGFRASWEPLEPGESGLRGGRLTLWLTIEQKVSSQRSLIRSVQTTVRVRSQ